MTQTERAEKTDQALKIARQALKIAREALERLACLGNGDRPGNSDGNVIAKVAVGKILDVLAPSITNQATPDDKPSGMTLAEAIEARPWHLAPAAKPPADMTTVEALAALADGKRVRQVHPHDGGVWTLKDGYFRCSKGTVCDAISLTATDLLNSRYRVEP